MFGDTDCKSAGSHQALSKLSLRAFKHALYRHGARYPSSNSAPAAFAAKLAALKGGFNATGALAFLNSWTYKLGTDLLLPVGRQQDFDYGVQFNYQYGYLLRNFTRQGKLPVFRTTSQDRMVKTATNFLAGLFGMRFVTAGSTSHTLIVDMSRHPGVPHSGSAGDRRRGIRLQ